MSEFSRPFALDALRDRDVRQRVSANAQECAALAARFGILEIRRLEADLSIRRVRGGRAVRVEGQLSAEVSQACVVSLVPVVQDVEADFVTLFVPAEDLKPLPVDEAGEIDADAIDPDAELEEALPDGPLDLGELVAQELAVSLDPYPRAAGATFQARWGAEDEPEAKPLPEGRTRPFADLQARLKKEK
ncbi:MAG: DUF177 domain-containing protein [Rhodospirillales bacterium]|nr:DUF177 domain-containing protein [Rhodospirillales bacterium]